MRLASVGEMPAAAASSSVSSDGADNGATGGSSAGSSDTGSAGDTSAGGNTGAAASVSLDNGVVVSAGNALLTFADARFTKYTGRVEIDEQLGKRFVVRVRGIGQYSDDPLPAAERIVVGGAEYGRAFDTAILTGDRGFAGLGELAWRPVLPTKWQGSELYGFVDGSRAHLLQRPVPARDLRSLIGRRWRAICLSTESVARPPARTRARAALFRLSWPLASIGRLDYHLG